MNLHDVKSHAHAQIDLAHEVIGLVNAVERVHALHEPYLPSHHADGWCSGDPSDYWCGCCDESYPCATIRALAMEMT